MKKIILVLFLLVMAVGCGEKVINRDQLQQRDDGFYIMNTNKKFTGKMESFSSNGKKWLDCQFKKGLKHGEENLYDSDTGYLIRTSNYKNDLPHGKQIVYFPEGEVGRISHFKKGVLTKEEYF